MITAERKSDCKTMMEITTAEGVERILRAMLDNILTKMTQLKV